MATHRAEKECGKRIKPPKTFMVANRTYTLRFVDRSDEYYGRAIPGSTEVLLSCTLPPRFMAEILVHEIMHCILADFAGCHETPGEEFYVRTLATGLTKVFSDNPALFAWWLYLMCAVEDK